MIILSVGCPFVGAILVFVQRGRLAEYLSDLLPQTKRGQLERGLAVLPFAVALFLAGWLVVAAAPDSPAYVFGPLFALGGLGFLISAGSFASRE